MRAAGRKGGPAVSGVLVAAVLFTALPPCRLAAQSLFNVRFTVANPAACKVPVSTFCVKPQRRADRFFFPFEQIYAII